MDNINQFAEILISGDLKYETIVEFDGCDPLAPFAEKFDLPNGLIYLDGNSLGAMPKTVPGYLENEIKEGWAKGLIRSWNGKGWHNMPLTLGNRLAPMMGADAGEVLLVDSTSLNLFKTLVAAIKMRPGRSNVVSEKGNFPSDVHIMQGVIDNFFPQINLVLAEENDEDILSCITAETAVVTLTHVN
ncbi:MAG: kynureninase, partial [Proteobacteria bacterium]|nr:kynureninase [Pseudomonadota bacterium]